MRRPSLGKTSLFSLLGLTSKSTPAAAQSTPSDPSSTNLGLLTSFSPSTETLVPSSTTSESVSALPTGDYPFTVSLAQPTGNGTTIATPISQTTSRDSSSRTGSNTQVVYMGEAVPTGYRKIGLAGALAGAAGVFMV